jgi:hypothetical protein
MPVATFDTLKYAQALRAADVPEKQAEAQPAALSEAVALNLKDLATKSELEQTAESIRKDIFSTAESIRKDIVSSADSLRYEMKDVDQRSIARDDLLREQIRWLQWMVGGVLLGVVTMLFKVFLGK